MNNELLDPQSEVQSLAVVTTEEIESNDKWFAECDAERDEWEWEDLQQMAED